MKITFRAITIIFVFIIPYTVFYYIAILGNWMFLFGERGLKWLNTHPMLIKELGWKVWIKHYISTKK